MAGNPDYDGIVAFAAEKQLKKTWSVIWCTEWPLLAKIRGDGLNYNTAETDPNGTCILLPVNYLGPATSARAGTNANAFTPITPTPTQGFTQAKYFYARYENALYLNATEKQLIAKNADTTRMPILPGKVTQLVNDFKNIISTDLLGTQNGTGQDGNGLVTGERYFLSTSNSPGNISQTTYSTWAAKVRSNVGPWYEGLVDRAIHRIKNLGRGPADFMQLSYDDSNDVYGKMLGLIAPAQLIISAEKMAKYGFESFSYRGLDCFQDGRLGTALPGSAVIGRSSSWYVNTKSDQPVPSTVDGQIRLPGTTSEEHMYEQWITWGNDDPAGDELLQDIA